MSSRASLAWLELGLADRLEVEVDMTNDVAQLSICCRRIGAR